MKQLVVTGGTTLRGVIPISGAKNSAVALLPAAILCNGVVTIHNVPNISDIEAIKEILLYLGANITCKENSIMIDSRDIKNQTISETMATKLRASYYFMGALLGRFQACNMSLPGGCPIGARPMNLHLEGFETLGCTITPEKNQYIVTAKELKGDDIDVQHSVGATINLLFASVLAHGETRIHQAAMEPEITNVIELLQQMGADIKGTGTDELIVSGVSQLHDAEITVIPDRIEAGTYLIAGALCGEQLEITNVYPDHITALLETLQQMGVPLQIQDQSIIVSKPETVYPCEIETAVYPGFPTDLQQPITPLMTMASGLSKITETIYENRFKHVPYLNQMGADIKVEQRLLAIIGPTELHGSTVEATDLRAGASLVLASLIAKGQTFITEVNHILRGYENIVEKLQSVGAKIELREI
ncbi:MAG: UDP-N-acetylglucosamine 1-carboxyvinyltransferase [Bacilli bacterium]|nr:UDP-N-acetylglucosamine 1-carboxyvinyltransferase [Bacilli bacterium]